MFTGLIESVGSVESVEERSGARRITIAAPEIAGRLHTGDSVAVSGVCLTALDISADRFHADLAEETVARTSLTSLVPGSPVNLELPTPAGTPMGGHVVQGHVDGTGKLLSLDPVHAEAGTETDWWLRVLVPANVAPYIIEKGSIAIEGISLTVARWEPGLEAGDVVSVAIIPHTYAHTNLHALKRGQAVNLEADVMLKFLRDRAKSDAKSNDSFDLTLEFLIAHGY